MSEIVRIKASGAIGVVRATYINAETGEELVEVQPVGRNMIRFVTRKELEPATQKDIGDDVAKALILTANELEKTIFDVCDDATLKALRVVRGLASDLIGPRE